MKPSKRDAGSGGLGPRANPRDPDAPGTMGVDKGANTLAASSSQHHSSHELESSIPKPPDAPPAILDTATPIENMNRHASKEIYLPLHEVSTNDDRTLRKVRLVTIKRDVDSEPIRCSLATTTLEECQGSYDALSYCWGTEDDLRDILLNGLKFVVTRNLFDALQSIRRIATKADKDCVMWIDALCIDQLNIGERNSQVRHMHMIYEYAAKTVIWLGFGTEHGYFAMRILEKGFTEWGFDELCEVLVCLKEKGVLRFYLGLTDLYKCQYWTRVWVVQEVFYSMCHDIIIVWGTTTMSYKHLVAIQYDIYGSAPDDLPDILQHFGKMEELVSLQQLFSKGGPQSMPSTAILEGRTGIIGEPALQVQQWVQLERLAVKNCKNPKDHVFGFYHVFPEAMQDHITIDYATETTEIYLEATLACMYWMQRLDILAWPRTAMRSIGQPSWIRDWSTKEPSTTWLGWDFPDANLEDGEHEVEFKYMQERRALRTFGITIGTIDQIYEETSLETAGAAMSHDDLITDFWGAITDEWGPRLLSTRAANQSTEMLQYWALVALNLGRPPMEGVMNLFEEDLTADTPGTCIEWLEQAYKRRTQRVLVEVRGTYEIQRSTRYSHAHMLDRAYGMVNPQVQTGDLVCVLGGCSVPLALRKLEGGEYALIGDIYVTTLADVQNPEWKMLEASEEEELVMSEFILV